METLTYPYGETPEEVIRDAWEQADPVGEIQRVSRECALYTESETSQEHAADLNAAIALLPYRTADDLLTVLDALKAKTIAAQLYRKQEFDYAVEPPNSFASGRLRISILAALGIAEG